MFGSRPPSNDRVVRRTGPSRAGAGRTRPARRQRLETPPIATPSRTPRATLVLALAWLIGLASIVSLPAPSAKGQDEKKGDAPAAKAEADGAAAPAPAADAAKAEVKGPRNLLEWAIQ